MSEQYTFRQKAAAIKRVASFRPKLTIGVMALSVLAALFEAVGLSFILPVLELAQGNINQAEADGILGIFVSIYGFFGIPFTLGFMILGIAAVMTVRFSASFLVAWLRSALMTLYVKHLQTNSFERALDAEIAYFDKEGSDDILNAIVTQSEYAGRAIRDIVRIVEQGLLAVMYFLLALVLAPLLTLGTGVVLGGVIVLFKSTLESGSSVGDRLADANEEVQESVQAGTQGIRDVKVFGLENKLLSSFYDAVGKYADSRITISRNRAFIKNFYQLIIAVSIFVLIYIALEFTALSLGALGVFLFAIFRLGPKVSTLSNIVYELDSNLPHLIRTQEFIDEMDEYSEPSGTNQQLGRVQQIEFDQVGFSYDTTEEIALRDVSFHLERGDFVAFVGQSGAGKSTIVSLLARMYEPDKGAIRADGTDISEYPASAWRERVSVVRQNPFIFNDTMWYNVTVGKLDASSEEVERACEIAQVTEFLDELPNGYDTVLGDDGVRLSGGQRQRIAIARALLKDADVLLLDEATSDLDTGLEEQVHDAIEQANRDYGLLVVAHRLSTVTDADQIYVMDQGEIVEQGEHSELLSRSGIYERLRQGQVVN